MDQFLQNAGTTLQLALKPKVLYNESGVIVRDLDRIQDGEVLFVSCGEPFVRSGGSPQVANARPQSALAATQVRPRASSPVRGGDGAHAGNMIELQAFQRAIAGSLCDHNQNWKLAVASVFDSLPAADRQQLGQKNVLQAIRDILEQALMMDRLASEGIVGHPLGLKVGGAVASALNGVTAQTMRLVVMGPSGTGKSSLLAALCLAVVRKLQLSSSHGAFLVVPLRFEATTPDALARHLSSAAFDAIPACSSHLLAASKTLRTWFFNAAFGVALRVPSVDGVKLAALAQAAEAIRAALAGDEFAKFCDAAAALPFAIASAFGFVAPLFVIDNASLIDRIDAPDFFARRVVTFSEVFAQLIVDHAAPFIATGLGQASPLLGLAHVVDVADVVPVDGAEPLEADGLLVRPADCRGAPGLAANFRAAKDAAEASELGAKKVGVLPKFVSTGSKSLSLRASHEFARLYRGVARLAHAGELGA